MSKSGQHSPINHYRIVNQPNNSLTSYINYHDFHFVNNKNVAEPNAGSIKLYKGKIGPNRVQFHMVQGIKHAPGMIMQNISYDPQTNRIYFVTDGELMSIPAKNYGHLKPSQVKTSQLTGHYEFEDLAFYRDHGYLLLHYPSELMTTYK